MKKILSLALVGVMMFSALPMAYAADNTYTNPDASTQMGTDVTVVGDGGEYYVSVPATLEPGQTGTVRAYGVWQSNQTLSVTTDSTVEVTNSDTDATTEVNVTFAGIAEAGNDLEDMDVTASISIDKGDIRFGEWKGVITYNVELARNDLISFKIASKSYQAEVGMTWAEWVNSAFNTDDYVIKGENNIGKETSQYYVRNGNDNVTGDLAIIAGQVYFT